MYGQGTPTASGTTLADVRNKLTALQEMKRTLLNSATRIFQLHRCQYNFCIDVVSAFYHK